MALWPFSLIWPSGMVNNRVPTHTELNKLDEQLAQAADGSAWSDVAFAENYPYIFTDANGGRVCIYNPIAKTFWSFNVVSGDPVGFAARAPFVVRQSQAIPNSPTGLIPTVAAVDPVRGTMIMGGTPGSSTQSRICTHNGLPTNNVWVRANNVMGANTSGPTSAIYCGGTIDKYIIGFNIGAIEYSTGVSAGAAWTNVASPGITNARGVMAFSPLLNRLIVLCTTSGGGSGLAAYLTSDDGVNYTDRTAPVAFHYVFWSAFRSVFFAVQCASPNFWSSPDGITWSSLGAGADHPRATPVAAVQMFEFRRLIGCLGQGSMALSVNGLASWQEGADFASTGGFAARSDNGFQTMFGTNAGVHKATLRIGT